MNEKGLGRKLADARRASGLTQQELCQKSSLSYSTLAKIERGAIKSPSIFTIQQIAGVLGTTVDALLGIAVPNGSKPVELPKKRSKSGIEFVYFDINGCVVRFFHQAFAHVAKDTGISSDIVETAFWHYNDAVCRGEMSMDEFNKVLARQFKQDKLDWAQYYLDAVDPIAETADLMGWAKEHYHIGLLSNIMPGFIEAMRGRGLVPDLAYDAIIDSSVVQAIKPEPRIFELACEQTKVDPSSILLIDDSRANLMAAERLGWRVLWFDDFRPKESVERIKQALEF